MKIKRLKSYKRTLDVCAKHFGLSLDPLEVFVDSTFANQALLNKLNIKDQLEYTFKLSVKLVTSSCTISECESLKPLFSGALKVLLNFKILNCKHKFDPNKGAPWCIRRRIRTAFKTGFIKSDHSLLFALASNDESLQAQARSVPGMPILFVAHKRINLEPMSLDTKKELDTKFKESISLSSHESEFINSLAAQYGITSNNMHIRKKRRRNEPNPLACRKKRVQPTVSHKKAETVRVRRKRKRKRIHNTWAFQQALLHLKREMFIHS
ncbi:U3 small nucleolar RNA-associated protein 23 [Fasciola gigantica]|uniref:U3 small nucleolar RNA-associated protein 23 n=1 Tax=Fasciola gigantica TaxID=46835 RepID=A0A504Z615_FASGI|nr:U3 small nucleolar RNA-associated protein 23 [Fasciola gigantica]